jgi:hypothetical protein
VAVVIPLHVILWSCLNVPLDTTEFILCGAKYDCQQTLNTK